MPLPPFTGDGNLPDGIHPATWDEVVARFGTATPQRCEVMTRLERVRALAVATGCLDRLVVFGSFVTAKPDPNDVDVVVVFRDAFRNEQCPAECAVLLDHRRADAELGASVFWVRPGMLFGEPLESFLAGWCRRRDLGRRGIVEVRHDQ